MTALLKKNLDKPDEVRTFKDGMGQLQLVTVDTLTVGRATFPVGWRWSTHVGPIAGTASCQAAHTGYVLSGSMTVRSDSGEEMTFGAGDVMVCAPGHDAWTVGDTTCVVLDWQGFTEYARS
jgi:quercetin dioxygenase-like cupin family protein